MSIVTGVEKAGAVYRIYADGRLLARINLSAFERSPLREGDVIDEDAYLESVARDQADEAYEAALSALDRAAKSRRALQSWLELRGYVGSAVDEAIARLLRARLLDDGAIAGRLVETGVAGGLSARAIRRKLQAKGIEEEDIDAALQGVTEDSQLAAATELAQALPEIRLAGTPRRAGKLSQALARRGFSWDVIDRALRQLPL